MKKFFLKYSFLLIWNLIFFLSIWYFLDKYFETNWKILIWVLIFSIIPLIIITSFMIKKNIKELEKLAPKKEEKKDEK
jgi:F0F1-type ATP synthase assembly protein I